MYDVPFWYLPTFYQEYTGPHSEEIRRCILLFLSRVHKNFMYSCSYALLILQGGVENVQYATTIKKGGGSARAVRSVRSASHLEPGLFLAIILPGIDFVVVQHLIRGLFDKLEERQQFIVRLSGRSTCLVSGIVSVIFLAVQVSVQFCIRSSSSCSSTCCRSLSDSHVVNFRAVGKPWELRVRYVCFL